MEFLYFVIFFFSGGGCGKELANWVIHGRPELDMYRYDVTNIDGSDYPVYLNFEFLNTNQSRFFFSFWPHLNIFQSIAQ